MQRTVALTFALAFAALALPRPACSEAGGETRALIIGIDNYRREPALKGAVADARDIGASMRKIGASDVTLLLDAQADRSSILRAFDDLLARVRHNDTVLVSLAGHGAQEPERWTGSEPDGMEAVFLLANFDPKDRKLASEKMLHSEFNHFIAALEDKGARVIFVADAFHGGALMREADPRGGDLRYRSVTFTPLGDDLKSVATRADAMMSPVDFKRSIFLSAADRNSKAPEIFLAGAGFRGALSYAVARAFAGAADLNGDGLLTVDELLSYVRDVTYQLTDQRQQIAAAYASGAASGADAIARFGRGVRVEPVGASTQSAPGSLEIIPVDIQSPDSPVEPPAPRMKTAPSKDDPIRIATLDGQTRPLAQLAPHGPYQAVAQRADADLIWDPASKDVLAGGDVIAHNVAREDLPIVIDRAAAIRWFKGRAAQAPQTMRLLPNDKLHHKSEQVEVEVTGLAGRSLILFDIAGDGTLQLLYPRGSDAPVLGQSQQRVPLQFFVREPFGADAIISVSAARRQAELEEAIRQLDGRRNPYKAVEAMSQYAQEDAAVGVISLFTAP
nr:caspase family protein [Methylocystis heyeri]